MSTSNVLRDLTSRRDEIVAWLELEAPQILAAQEHLADGTSERAYWHHGYQAALRDVIQRLQEISPKAGSADRTMQ
jgi:hypothetical protein